MHSQNLLENFRADIKTLTGTEVPKVPEVGPLDIQRVLQSLYFFS